MKELKTLKHNLFNETGASRKEEYKKQIDELIGKVTNNHKDFDFKVYFFEVFHENEGFDVVIGNPPYVGLQKITANWVHPLRHRYETFAPNGDIYYLFYEKGMNLLKQGCGYICFISSNQWMRVDSGKALRKFIKKQNPVRLVNLGSCVFENVTVNTCILLVSRSSNKNALQASDLRKATEKFPPTEWISVSPSGGDTWTILSAAERRLREKIEAAGIPLKRWEVKINRGIVTGYNKAFIIKDEQKQAFIDADPKSAEIIKPVLCGENIQRFNTQWAGLWLITTFPSLRLDIDSYPVIKKHLLLFGKDRLEQSGKILDSGGKARKKTRHSWFETQDSIAYHEEFAKEKIVWGNLANRASFSCAPEGMFVNAPATFLTPFNHYLLAVLNSKLLDWYFHLIGVERDGGYYEYKPMFIERMPIPKISTAEQRPFIQLVDQILTAKKSGADTTKPEAEIDKLVYQLYGLTDEEIRIVENHAR